MRKKIYYPSLAAIVALAVIALGWPFWPEEKLGSALNRETIRPSLSQPSKATVPVQAALSEGEKKPGNAAGRSAEAKALQDKALGLAEKNPKEAKALLLKAVELDPRSVRGHFQLGLAYMALEDSPRAIEAYQKVIELDPRFPDAFFNLGYIHAANKNYPKAEEIYSQVVNLAPPYLDEALFNLGMVQEKQGKKEKCLANLKRALQVNPQNEMARKFYNKLNGNS